MKLASLKMVFAVVLVSSVLGSQAFAQSAMRADEKINNPQAYRLGDSDDMQADQRMVDDMKVCNESQDKKVESIQRLDLNKPASFKRLIKHSDV